MIRESSQTLCTHHGENDDSNESAGEDSGSDPREQQMAEPGVASSCPNEVMHEDGNRYPSFCGGASSLEMTLEDAAPMEVETYEEAKQVAQQTLDYVLQNLHFRLGNPRNRCYANAPFRLWAWAGSFLSGGTRQPRQCSQPWRMTRLCNCRNFNL